MSLKTRIHGYIVPTRQPNADEMVVLADELNKNGLSILLYLSMEGLISADTTLAGQAMPFDSLDFASRLAALIDNPGLGDLIYHGEFLVIADTESLPSIKRFAVKAGSITYTKARVTWSPTSTIIRPAELTIEE